jgi:hypothetical protein
MSWRWCQLEIVVVWVSRKRGKVDCWKRKNVERREETEVKEKGESRLVRHLLYALLFVWHHQTAVRSTQWTWQSFKPCGGRQAETCDWESRHTIQEKLPGHRNWYHSYPFLLVFSFPCLFISFFLFLFYLFYSLCSYFYVFIFYSSGMVSLLFVNIVF